jgi:hypothetical protein
MHDDVRGLSLAVAGLHPVTSARQRELREHDELGLGGEIWPRVLVKLNRPDEATAARRIAQQIDVAQERRKAADPSVR